MAKKKTGQLSISQEAQQEAQQVFAHYHQLAETVRATTERQASEAALAEINDLSEAAQFALLKSLAREKTLDAADLLVAVNELSPHKSVRKEARRALLQLASARVYPQWKPPAGQPLVAGVEFANVPHRFYEGTVTDSLDAGEVQVLLAFEQGEDYNEIRLFGFLLDFVHDGVRESFNRVMSRRRYENTVAEMARLASEVETIDCSLAKGRRLIQDALATNKRTGTQPYFEFRRDLPLINQYILEAPDIEEEEEEEEEEEREAAGEPVNIQDLTPENVVITFVDSYFDGNFSTAYQLLATDSPLRDNLSQEAWVESRTAWLDKAHPESLEPNLLWERPAQKSGLWLPNIVSARRAAAGKTFEAGWSVEMDEASEGDSFAELPRASTVYDETQRHWFWVSYNLVQEEGQWRIQFMTDEASEALNLPTDELNRRIQEHDQVLTDIIHKIKPGSGELLGRLGEMSRHLLQSAGYIDALLARSYDDLELYLEASERMGIFGFTERALVYLEQVAQRFEQQRASALSSMGVLQLNRSHYYDERGDITRAGHFLDLADASLHESLALEDRLGTHISLAEVLIERDKDNDLDEARNHLLQAKTMLPPDSSVDEAHIEMHLGEVALEQGHAQEALEHYRRVAELEPDFANSWSDLARAYRELGNIEEADANFRRALSIEPDNEDIVWDLGEMYLTVERFDEAIQVFEDALAENPDSIALNSFLASAYLRSGDTRQAEIFIAKAEKLDPQDTTVQALRQILELFKKDNKLSLSGRTGKKAKRKHR